MTAQPFSARAPHTFADWFSEGRERSRVLLRGLVPLALVVCAACAGPQPPEAQAPRVEAPAPKLPPPASPVHGAFTLEHANGAASDLSWSAPEGHVFCRWYAEPERGDYLWIRLAQTPEQDGDAGPRLDMDVCRLSQRPNGRYAPMPAGAHGSHCSPDPGFAIWWHEGDDAFNNGAGPADPSCALEIEFDAASMTLSGEFACADLASAPHAETKEPELQELGPVSVLAGRFRCDVQRMPPRPTS